MSRPTNKEELLTASQNKYTQLYSLIQEFTVEEQVGTFPFEDRDRNIRDVLIHLYEWQQLLLNLIQSNHVDGVKAPFFPAPYTMRTTPELNQKFWESHQQTTFTQALTLFETSHAKVMDVINKFSNEELFSKKFFTWTGSTSLGSYCVSATSSHYDWAIKKIRKYKKTL